MSAEKARRPPEAASTWKNQRSCDKTVVAVG